jgi:type I restriction enzyme, S subunit
MMNGWGKKVIGEMCEITSSKRIYSSDYMDEGVPFYRVKEIIEKQRGVREVSSKLFISEKKYQGIKNKFSVPRPGDLLLTSIGMTRGIPYVIQPNERFYFKDGNLTWFRNFKKLNSRFLYYWLLSFTGKSQLERCTIGAAQPAYTIASLKKMEGNLPSVSVQNKIASILSAYDDLIENNTRSIAILEEMAQMIYREWFVKFRFPGHEKVKMVDSPLGKIPEGWEVKTVNDFVDIKSGFAFKSKTFDENGKYGLVTIKNVKDGVFLQSCNNQISERPSNLPNHCELITGDILLSLTGNIGRVCLLYGNNYLLNQRVAKLASKNDVGKAFIYFTFRQEEFRQRLEKISTGVAQQNLSPIEMGKMQFLIPSTTALEKFSVHIDSFIDQILSRYLTNKNLRQTRDLLLPKLISGELDVSDLDIEIPEIDEPELLASAGGMK